MGGPQEPGGSGRRSSPILDYRGFPIAALWVVGPNFRLAADKFDHVGPIVLDHALQVSRRFGYDPVK